MYYFIKEKKFDYFIQKVIADNIVIGPVKFKSKFKFEEIKNVSDLRMDYDVTMLPPKKEFFPTRQDLVKFENGIFEGCVRPIDKVLIGVHPYDIKAIELLDKVFEENHKDINYMANRENTAIIGSSVQTLSSRSFWGSVIKLDQLVGHDGFLTKITGSMAHQGGYIYQVITQKGEEFLKYGEFINASVSQIKKADEENRASGEKCEAKMKYDSSIVAAKMNDCFDNNELWSEMAESCFSCGSCNIVCPTCYCFDVQDKWNSDQVSGVRTRTWDGCLTEDFAKISLGKGAEENFREGRGSRFRHRIMRKTAYLNKKFNAPACVGCGRCASVCTSDIADPVAVINKVMEV